MSRFKPGLSRVLVIRCCRTARLLEAVKLARQRFPSAALTVLAHQSSAAEVAECGLADVITYASRRLGVAATARTLPRLRHRFNAVIVPYAVPDDAGHANVLRLAAAIDAPETVIMRGDEAGVCHRRGLRRLALGATLRSIGRSLDVPLLLAAVAVATVVPWRRAPRPAARRKVLHVVTGLGAGGAQVQIAELASRTPPHRFAIDVLVLAPYEGRFALQSASWPDVRVLVFDAWPNLVTCLRYVYRLCRRERYDVVHTRLFYANIIGAAAARLAGVPRIIASVRNLSLWKRDWYNRPWFRLADALASRAADVVTVNSRSLVDDHARWAFVSPDRIHVVANGLTPDTLVPLPAEDRVRLRREFGLAEDTPVLGTVGRLAPEKDQATFLRIVAALQPEIPGLHAVIVGGGDAEPSLRGLARTLGIERAVTFAGERSDARFLMAGFDLLLLTSRCEGLPNVLLEAAFLEVPSASTDVGGAGDIVEPERLFPAGDVAAGTRLVATLLTHPSASRAAAARARQRALERFTAERAAADWLALYEHGLLGEAA